MRLYLRIATMLHDAPLEPIKDAKPNWAAAAELAHEWELNALAKRLDDLAKAA